MSPLSPSRFERARPTLRIVLAVFMIAIGIAHFVVPEAFVFMSRASCQRPSRSCSSADSSRSRAGRDCSSVRVRRLASYGLVALHVLVFPANINMLVTGAAPPGVHLSSAALWLRLPLQLVLIAWAIWAGRDPRRGPVAAARVTP